MSNRILLGLLLALCAGTAAGAPGTTRLNEAIPLGDGPWLLYRPPPREVQMHDPDYMMDRLRCSQTGLGLRFSPTRQLRFDLTLAPLVDKSDYIGPVYDMDIGATRLVLSISF
jgi:hypothetical protein